jgi:hypothetical protein
MSRHHLIYYYKYVWYLQLADNKVQYTAIFLELFRLHVLFKTNKGSSYKLKYFYENNWVSGTFLNLGMQCKPKFRWPCKFRYTNWSSQKVFNKKWRHINFIYLARQVLATYDIYFWNQSVLMAYEDTLAWYEWSLTPWPIVKRQPLKPIVHLSVWL